MVGVPQLADSPEEVLGGNSVTSVVGAVPNVLNGDAVAVPPDMTSLDPTAEPPGSVQVVVMTSCVPEPAVLAATLMNCPV